ncbi:hypothetical protein [Pseudomonas sp. GL-RE-19]|uniref:hypothetical protein n=1 Tax=Pseudomonas sp. GL-RE-19 TaxID=2832389 RepID=UPI001CC08D80|nr:hypothetical protein [Pseudomonas sp. GL-RE-19]
MGWDRKAPSVVQAPTPPMLGRWVLAAVVAVVVGVLLFLLHASIQLAQLQAINVWLLSGSPLLVWVLLFGSRAYFYGGALSQHQFLEEEAVNAQLAWQYWAQRYLAVHTSCVLLPDQVSASGLQVRRDLPLRTGQARRIAALPEQGDRAQAGLQMLLPVLGPALQALPAEQALRVTLLSDVEPDHYAALRDVWQQWKTAHLKQPATVTLTNKLSCQWIDDTLKSATAALDLILVMQVNGGEAYSDGLAALLLCPDQLAVAWDLPVQGGLLRPMPLDVATLNSELELFQQTQTMALQATGVLADSADWRPLTGNVFATIGGQAASLSAQQLWVQEHLCGLPGPFGHWLATAFGLEMVRHQRQAVLLLAKEESRYWISTVSAGEVA